MRSKEVLRGELLRTIVVWTLIGLGLRLLIWHWREFFPLGGDEQEYLNAAVTLLRDKQYTELLFMRPPLYPVFLAANIYFSDSLVQNLRLAQAILSALTIPLAGGLAFAVARASIADGSHQFDAPYKAASWAIAFMAACYTLAANATELLSETLFLSGLIVALWLVIRIVNVQRFKPAWALLAGIALGLLALVRSVALPLVPLAALWLLVAHWPRRDPAPRRVEIDSNITADTPLAEIYLPKLQAALGVPLALVLGCVIVVAPWTWRNFQTYGGLIVIDTTGAENLWLDNDPRGREAVKAELFAMGEARLQRQQLASSNGIAVISADPARFFSKAGDEIRTFFALEYTDDMLARPNIWVRPADVGLRLIFGDGFWLLLLFAGSYGLLYNMQAAWQKRNLRDPSWMLLLWVLYIILTAGIFHTELRYRLPLYPALIGHAALTMQLLLTKAKGAALWAWAGPLAAAALILSHQPYLNYAFQLVPKHFHLAVADSARIDSSYGRMAESARAALAADPDSVLARVMLAQALAKTGGLSEAEELLREAIVLQPDYPYSHLLRGDLLRLQNDPQAARPEFSYETSTLEDAQQWLWDRLNSSPPARLEVGDGLDLGFITGFHAQVPADEGYRWTKREATLQLYPLEGQQRVLVRMASGRPDGSSVTVRIAVNGAPMNAYDVGPEWAEYAVPLPNSFFNRIEITLTSDTFTPREFDPASPDGRTLGVMVDTAQVERTE